MISSFLAWKPNANMLVTFKVSVNGIQQFPNMAQVLGVALYQKMGVQL